MTDIVLDTQIFVDFMHQYYSNKVYEDGLFIKNGFISDNLAKYLNNIVERFRAEGDLIEGIVCTSILTFIEISRKFDLIAKDKFTLLQFKSFLANRPDWVKIAPFTSELYEQLYNVPKVVTVSGHIKTVEWADAVHCATYLTRDKALLATTDGTIKSIAFFSFVN
ncbi:hypothetical protein [Sphingobacterium spiritivorum]|uniref:hypothetical protein n=1 Tax=Sphingobacterium spiritivorum TaxID=258 RepID=UPI00191B43D4|nr:hypothetical protein [Sphingobacterium spiritivorum]QQT27633.1 hypothetical protein I6J02_07260 [Sphingobacterium spiritivorum]